MADAARGISTAVARADTESSGSGLTVTITVVRTGGRVYSPRAADVPADVREALQRWLDSARG